MRFCFTASAVRDGFGVLRVPTTGLRQSIVGRSDFFVRFGDKEREAMANFDFLDDLSATSPGSADSSSCDQPPSPAARGNRCYVYTCSPPPSATAATPLACGSRRPRTSSPLLPRDGRRQRRRRYSGLSLSDSCGDSDWPAPSHRERFRTPSPSDVFRPPPPAARLDRDDL